MSDRLRHYEMLFGQRRCRSIDRLSLPMPWQYLSDHGLLFRRPRSEWVLVRCPAHKGGKEVHPSMSVSLTDGHFRCHACGAKGGDIVALHMLVTGKGFIEAVRDLGGRFHD